MLTLDRLVIAQGGFNLQANFSVAAGASVAVIGPSGAGKSTLLSVLAGFLDPQSGAVVWGGENLTALPPGKRPLSILFQDGNLFPHLTVSQNIGLGLRPDLKLSAAQYDAVAYALRRVGLDGLGSRKPAALSGGQQSRVALARMLLRARPLLLLDEPFSALGPALKAEMLDLVADLLAENGTTLLMVSHDPDDARRIADQTVLVAEGCAHPPRKTADLFNDPPESLRAYLGV